MGEKFNLETVLYVINWVSIVMGFASIGCIISGILTLIYASPFPPFPYSTGSGIWCGVVTLLVCIFGNNFAGTYNTDDPSGSRRSLMAFYMLIVMDVTLGALNATYSGIGLASCVNHSKTDGGELMCKHGSLKTICALNLLFGLLVTIVAIATTIYMNIGHKLRWLAGHPVDPQTPFATCCNGSCKCYYNTAVA